MTVRIKICGIVDAEDALAAVDAGAALIGLNFVPSSPRQRFCSQTHQKRRWQREKYQNDPEWRARKKAQDAEHYAETATYARARERRRYWADPERHRARVRRRYHANKTPDTDQETAA